MFIDGKKGSLIFILKVLEEYSDNDHYLTQQDIINKISSLYGLELERKTIGANINLLIELGYDIVKKEKGGYCLLSRLFDVSEVKFLIDAIYSSKTLTGKQANELAKAISSTLSKYERKEYNYLYKSEEINRNINKDFFLNIDIINEAIKENKMISFNYITYDNNGKQIYKYNGFRYKVSPYYLVNNFGKYYLLSYYRYDKSTNFRVDYMRNIEILDTLRKPINEVSDLGDNFNISKYINNHIYMFGGELIDAVVKLENEQAITYVIDWFGSDVSLFKENDSLYAKIKCDDQAFIHWVLQYINFVTVVKPLYIKDKIIDILQSNLNKYKNDKTGS